MTDEMDARAAAAADTALNLFALSDDVSRAAMIGATIACAAALAEKTPLEFLDDLREMMPDDETWHSDRMGDRTRTKVPQRDALVQGRPHRVRRERQPGMTNVVDDYREALRPYADREFALLRARMRGQLTEREFIEGRALAYFGFGYLDAARRWTAKLR